MPKRISRDGSIVEPHAIKLEEMYQTIFNWFKKNTGVSKTDVIRNAVEEYYSSISKLDPKELSNADLRTRTQKEAEESKIVENEVEKYNKELHKIKRTIKSILRKESTLESKLIEMLDSIENVAPDKAGCN